MVATRPRVTYSIMTPGMNSSMLRARRRDKDIRPNRFLDRTASRGMLYENEKLRLRTMNINDDLEKGQVYIKKLRRENTQLRREIWNLRDQYDKLESVVTRSSDLEQETDRYRCDCGVEGEELGMLSIVPEESENEDSNSVDDPSASAESNDRTTRSDEQSPPSVEVHDVVQVSDVTKQLADLKSVAPLSSSTQNNLNEDGATKGDAESKMCSLKTCEHFVDVFRKNADEQRTFVFSLNGFENLTAQDVIDDLEQHFKEDCHSIFDGVRLTTRHCFLRVKDVESFKKVIETAGDLSVRGKPVQLEDVWEKSSVLQLSAVPHHVSDEKLVAIVSRFADVIGNVERQTYKGLDTGERFVHVITPEVIPCQLLVGSTCLPVTIVHSRRKSASISRRKSFRSQININLKTPDRPIDDESSSPTLMTESVPATPADPSASNNDASKPACSFSSKATDLVNGLRKRSNETDTNVFQFPSSSNGATLHVTTTTKKSESASSQQKPSAKGAKEAKNSTAVAGESPSAFRRFAQRSVSSFRRHNANCENSRPPSPAVFPGTPRLIRRASVNFRTGLADAFGRSRQVDCYPNEFGSGYVRERSASDASSRFSICRRKLSVTGHENSTKIPWCGCWGIGCC